MKSVRLLTICACVAAGVSAADPPLWEPLPLPALAHRLIEERESGAYVIASADWYTWCPSVIRGDDGKYHMFHSRWRKKIGFSAWLAMSEIVHEVADRPEGPYRFVAVAMPDKGPGRGDWFTAHNPKIERFDGKYYLYFIQTRGDMTDAQREEMSRIGGKHPRWMEIRNNQRTFVATAASLDGPWKVTTKPIIEPAKTITRITVNPAVCRRPDGTYLMIVKGDKPGETRFIRNQAVATAPNPAGPWTIQDKAAIDDLDTEDVSLWYAREWNRFFAVFHAHTFIGMIESDNGVDWRRARQFELTRKKVVFDDGSVWEPQRMERPFVLADRAGRPELLYVACHSTSHSLILAMPLRVR